MTSPERGHVAATSLCFAKRDNERAQQTECVNGHAFTADNTGRKPNGTRFCRACHRAFDRARGRDAGGVLEFEAKKDAAA